MKNQNKFFLSLVKTYLLFIFIGSIVFFSFSVITEYRTFSMTINILLNMYKFYFLPMLFLILIFYFIDKYIKNKKERKGQPFFLRVLKVFLFLVFLINFIFFYLTLIENQFAILLYIVFIYDIYYIVPIYILLTIAFYIEMTISKHMEAKKNSNNP